MTIPQRIVALVSLLWLMAVVCADAQSPQINSSFGDDRSGVAFTQNLGQIADLGGALRPEILYTTSFAGVDLFVAAGRISYVYRKAKDHGGLREKCSDHAEMRDDSSHRTELYRMDMELVGSNQHPRVVQSDQIPGFNNYYLAHCPDGVLNVGTYRTVVLQDLYPGIDMVLRGNDRGMKCDFVVHPGGRPSDIQMRYVGATTPPHLVGRGELRVENPFGFLQEDAPYTYQPALPVVSGSFNASNADGNVVASRWQVGEDGVVGFTVGSYDPTRPLVIDPTRSWATFYGGIDDESVRGSHNVDVDHRGDVCFTGATKGSSFPATIGPAWVKDFDMVVVKLKGDGTRLWATMLGGTAGELAHAIATDSARNVFIVGHTASSNLPVVNAHQRLYGANLDGIVAKFDTNGVRLWATYYGGNGEDDATGLAVDTAGNPVVTGVTASTNAISGGSAYDPSFNGGTYDAFLVQFNGSGVREWGTYLGGSRKDCGWAAAYDRYNNITISGWSASDNFPTLMPHQATRSGAYDLFVSQFTRLGMLRWSTYYGGTTNDASDYKIDELSGFLGIATDGDANVIIAGGTESNDFPVSNPAMQGAYGGGPHDGFIVKFNRGGTRLWATYHGGGGDEVIRGLACDQVGSLVGVGITTSSTLPGITADAFRSAWSGSADAFIIKVNAAGTIREYASYYGGTGYEDGTAVSTGPLGTIVLAGETTSPLFPATSGAFQRTLRGARDAFVVYFCEIEPAIIDTIGSATLCSGDSVVLVVASAYNSYMWSNGSTSRSITVRDSGTYYVDVANGNGCSVRSDSIVVVVRLQPRIAASRSPILCPGDSVILDAGSNYDVYQWVDKLGNTVGVGRSLTVKDSGLYVVRVAKDTCTGESAPISVRIVKPPTPRIIVAAGDTVICSGGSVALDGGIYKRYRWTTGNARDTIRRLTVTDSGLYQVMVTDSNGCTGLSAVVRVRLVDSLNPPITGLSVVCRNSVTTYTVPNLGGSSCTWTLTGGVGLITTGQGSNIVTVNWTSAGQGTLTVQQSSSVIKCSGTSTPFLVDVRDTLLPIITPEGSTELCYGDSIILRASPGYFTYTWTDDANTAVGSNDSLVARSAGRYSVAVDLGLCKGAASIVITERPPLPVIISGIRPLCEGDTLVLRGEPAGYAQYLWSTGDTTTTLRVATSGNYTLRVSDTGGCSATSSPAVIIVHPLPAPTITANGSDLAASPAVGYQWYLNGTAIPSGTTRTWQARINGSYTVRVTDSNGCSATSAAVSVMAGASATITIRDYQALPGDRVSIPLELSDGVNLDRNGIRNYSAQIRFNRTLLVPTQTTYPSSYVGDDRIMTINGMIPTGAVTNGPLTTLEFIAALGSVTQTPITIESFSFVEDTAVTTTINGTFSLTGLCTNGGTRLVDGSGATALRPVRPNPVVGTAEVEYEVVEDGLTQLYLVDILGRVTPVVHAELKAGRYVATFNVSTLSSGLYVCVLQTATQRMNGMMHVMR